MFDGQADNSKGDEMARQAHSLRQAENQSCANTNIT